MLLAPLLLLCPVLAAPPMAWQAEAVEARAGEVHLERPCLTGGGWRLTARSAARRPDPACSARWRLAGPVEGSGPEVRFAATGADVCGAQFTLHEPNLQTPRLRLAADRVGWADGVLTARGVRASGCGCDDPPWHVTARDAEWTPGGGVWAQWPVFWLGGVPVAASPVGYLPVGDRRSGVLAPRLGFDGRDGLHGRLPLFWAPSDRFDLTLSPGWRQARGLAGRGRLRWAQTLDDRGDLGARALWGDGVTLAGAGSASWGAARLSLDGALSSSEPARRAQFRGLPARQRDHLAQSTRVVVNGATGELGAQLLTLQDLRAQARPHGVWAQGWATWRTPAAGGTVALDLLTLDRLDRSARGQPDGPVADIALRAERPFSLGPLQLSPRLGAASVTHLTQPDGADQALVAWTSLTAEAAVTRPVGAGRHTWRLALDGRLAHASTRAVQTPLRPGDRPFSSQGGQARLESDLAGGRWRFRVGAALPYEAARVGEDAPGLGPALADLDLDLAAVSLLGAWSGQGAWWGALRLRPVDGLTLHAGGAELDPDAQHPWRRSPLDQRPVLLGSDVPGHRTANAGLGLAVGPARLDGRVVLDALDTVTYRGAWGALGWEGRCQCWSLRLNASHERGRPWPDASVALALTGL